MGPSYHNYHMYVDMSAARGMVRVAVLFIYFNRVFKKVLKNYVEGFTSG